MAIMRQSACLFANPIKVYIYDFIFNCTMVGQASDSLTVKWCILLYLGLNCLQNCPVTSLHASLTFLCLNNSRIKGEYLAQVKCI